MDKAVKAKGFLDTPFFRKSYLQVTNRMGGLFGDPPHDFLIDVQGKIKQEEQNEG